jgi:predicted DNA-binding transcriptional regulator AlpA
MWLWRRLNDDSGFPKPIYIGKRRFFDEAEILEWLDRQADAQRGAA